MPRASRHKSSRHGLRDARESSDSENDSSLRDRKGKESGSRVLKDSASSEKRRLDLKDTKGFYSSENREAEERGHSKRRKERYDEGTTDRWNGGSDDELGILSKKSKPSVDSKTKRRDENVGLQIDGEELQKSSGKGDGRHRELGRKESRNGGGEREKEKERDRDRDRDRERDRDRDRERVKDRDREKERKGREGKSERVVASEEHRVEKQVERNTETVLHSPGLENHLDVRVRKRAGSFDGDKHKGDIGDVENRQLSSKNDGKDGRRKSEKHKDERNREKYRGDADRDGKERDEQLVKDHISRSNDKDLRDEKDAVDVHHKRNKPQDNDLDREVTKGKREGDLDAMREQDHDRHHVHERDHDQESRHRRDRDRNHDQNGKQNRSRSRARDRFSDYECDVDRDGSHLEDQYMKYVDSRGRKRSPTDHDDSVEARSKSLKSSHLANEEKKSLSNDKVDSDVERRTSQSRSRHADSSLSNHRRKSSPSSLSRGGTDEYRHQDQEDLRDRYSKKEERSKPISTREKSVLSGVQEKGSKYTNSEKPSETDGGNAIEVSRDRSLNSKNGDIDENGRRHSTSVDAKDLSSNKDRHSWELQGEKHPMDDSSQAESYFTKGSQSNPSPFHPRPAFRGNDFPFDGSLEDDGRLNSNGRFRRGNDPNLGRIHGNTWRGVPNWTAPLPNSFIPFPHGPPHGSFQSIMPQFPTPPLFGIRPPLEINHSGIPYRMPEAERFSSHMHPLGWQNILDGSSPSHLHGWDGNNGVFRDESHIYSGAEWDENRQMVNGRGWESKAEMWKRQSGSLKRELPSQFPKDEHSVQDLVDDVSSREVCDESADTILTKTAELRPNVPSAKESPNTPELSETPTPLRQSMDDNSELRCSYLSKLKISTELAHPDLYLQCQRLMYIKHCATADEETSAYIILEGGVGAVSISSNSAHQSLIRPNKNSVFQAAMDLYKKQRMEMKEMRVVSAGMAAASERKLEEKGMQVVSVGVASSEGRLEEKSFDLNNEEVKAPVSTIDVEMAQAPIETTGDKETEVTAAASEKLEDLASTASEEVKCLENSEESLPVTNSTEVDMMALEQQANLEAEKDTVVVPNDNVAVNDTEKSSNNMDIKGNANGKDSTRCGVGNSCFDNAVSGPLSETCEGLIMAVSNGSESLILSQIHHSPESTH